LNHTVYESSETLFCKVGHTSGSNFGRIWTTAVHCLRS